MLRSIKVARLSPDQAINERFVGKRVRWAGAVHHIEYTDRGLCMTMLYAASGDAGEPHWTATSTNQAFIACTDGSYDAALVQPFTNVTIVGRITGKTYIGMGGGGSTGPEIEIERLFRWSDCLAGDTSAVCRYGFLRPVPADKK